MGSSRWWCSYFLIIRKMRTKGIGDFHKHLPNNLPQFILSYIRELWPGKAMIKVVLHLIVFWKAQQIAVLHVHQILWLQNMRNRYDIE